MATKVKLSKKLSDLFLTRDQARAITKENEAGPRARWRTTPASGTFWL